MAILATEKVLTNDYWKMAEDLRVGDVLFNRLGKPVTIKIIQKYRALRCFEVQFNDKLTVAGDEHLKLPLENEKYRKRVDSYKGKRKFTRPLSPTPLGKLIDTPLIRRENRKEYSVPTTGPLQLAYQDLPVHPFVFGFWFFNRRHDGALISPVGFEEFLETKLKECGYIPTKKHRFTTKPTVSSHLAPNIPYKIPNNYLLASESQRQELLSGIFHSKPRQYNPRLDTFRFSNKSKMFTSQVQYLAESLGCKTQMLYDETKRYYTVFIKTKLPLLYGQTPKPIKVRQEWRLVSDVYEINPQSCIHIETDGPDNSFLVGEGFIPCL